VQHNDDETTAASLQELSHASVLLQSRIIWKL